VQPILEATGKKVGKDFFLAFSPERIDPGIRSWTTANTPIVVGGVTPSCTRLAVLANEQIIQNVVAVSGPKVAEMEKLLENIFRSVNIALVNELAKLLRPHGGINMWEVSMPPRRSHSATCRFIPAPALADIAFLSIHFISRGRRGLMIFETNFITLAAETNESIAVLCEGFSIQSRCRTSDTIARCKILMVGVAFKRGCG